MSEILSTARAIWSRPRGDHGRPPRINRPVRDRADFAERNLPADRCIRLPADRIYSRRTARRLLELLGDPLQVGLGVIGDHLEKKLPQRVFVLQTDQEVYKRQIGINLLQVIAAQ